MRIWSTMVRAWVYVTCRWGSIRRKASPLVEDARPAVLRSGHLKLLTIVLAEDGEELGLSETSHGVVVSLVHRRGHKASFPGDPEDFLYLFCVEV